MQYLRVNYHFLIIQTIRIYIKLCCSSPLTVFSLIFDIVSISAATLKRSLLPITLTNKRYSNLCYFELVQMFESDWYASSSVGFWITENLPKQDYHPNAPVPSVLVSGEGNGGSNSNCSISRVQPHRLPFSFGCPCVELPCYFQQMIIKS